MISLELASMVGGGPGRWKDSVSAPVKKTARRAEILRRRVLERIAQRIKSGIGHAESRIEKRR
jgi:hypothetical protein